MPISNSPLSAPTLRAMTSVDAGSAVAPSHSPDAQPAMAALSLTPPGAPQVPESSSPQECAAAASQTRDLARAKRHNDTCPSRAEFGMRLLNQASTKLDEAKQLGVDVAAKSWFKKAIGVAVSLVAVGVAVALSAATVGGASPVLALACTNLLVSVGDAGCAYRNYKNAQAEATGAPYPYPKLPMGNSYIANGLHFILHEKLEVDDDTARTIGKIAGGVVGLGLIVSSIACGTGLAEMPQAIQIARQVVSTITGAQMALSTAQYFVTRDSDRDEVDQLLDEVKTKLIAAEPHLDDAGDARAQSIAIQLGTDNLAAANLKANQAITRGLPEQLIEDGPKAIAAIPGALAEAGKALLTAGSEAGNSLLTAGSEAKSFLGAKARELATYIAEAGDAMFSPDSSLNPVAKGYVLDPSRYA
jgi:hypothetical protein